jgi:hypothetical protein
MSSSVDKSSGSQSLLSGQNAVYVGIGWAVISLLFFLLFSISAPGEGRPLWYMLSTYFLETTPFIVGTYLCFRNWRSPQIASGRNVWLGIGLGMLSYCIGNLIFGVWELYWGLDPDVSPADLFYLLVYVFVGWGMVLAVLPRRLNLEAWQWATVAVIAVAGIAFAVWVLFASAQAANKAAAEPPATEQAVSDTASLRASNSLQAPALTSTSQASSGTKTKANQSASSEDSEKQVPALVMAIDEALKPLATPVNFFYIIGDVFLLIIAATLLLAFWGGRFAQSWRMIAAATLALYIADMCFKYADATAVEYESGSLPDVFYVFSGVLFAIGAALEYDVSSRSRRGVRKRA